VHDKVSRRLHHLKLILAQSGGSRFPSTDISSCKSERVPYVGLVASTTGEKDVKNIVTGTLTALLIAATTSLAMAQDQARQYYNSANGSGYGASQQYNTSPGSYDAGIGQER
jgi:hypothetical protein